MFNRSQEDINIESTREILEFFKNNSITNNIKEKLNLDLELDFSYNRKTVYLAVGLNKTYVIKTERKLEDFMDAYYKKYPYKFGVKFTYDSNKHFFSDEDKKILEFLFEYKKSERNYYYYQTLDPLN